MIERGEDFGFALEPRQPLGITGQSRGQHLDRNGPLQMGIHRAIDFAHTAHPDLTGDLIRAEAGARKEGHSREVILRDRS